MIATDALRVAPVVASVVDPVVNDIGIRMNEKDPGSARLNATQWEIDAAAPAILAVLEPASGYKF